MRVLRHPLDDDDSAGDHGVDLFCTVTRINEG